MFREITITDWQPPERFTVSYRVAAATVVCEHVLRPDGPATWVRMAVMAKPQGLQWLWALPIWLVLYPLDEVGRGPGA